MLARHPARTSSMPRLLVISPYAKPASRWGGPVPAVHDWAMALQRRGWDVLLASTDATPDGHSGVPTGETVVIDGLRHVFGRSDVGYPFFASSSLVAMMPRLLDGVDLVHLHGMWSATGLLAFAARARGIPYVITPHGSLSPWSMARRSVAKRMMSGLWEQPRVSSAAAVHFTCQAETSLAESVVALPHRVIAPCIVAAPEPSTGRDWRRELGIDATAPIVLFLSRIHVKKGLDLLLRAFASIYAPRGARLLVAGAGEPAYVEEVKALAGELGLGDVVHFLGMVRGGDKTSLFECSDVYALTSHQENFGIAVVESLRSGTPTLISPHVEIAQELEEAGAAAVEPLDVNSIASALARLIDNPRQARELGARGRAYAQAHYTEQVAGDALDGAFRAIAQGA